MAAPPASRSQNDTSDTGGGGGNNPSSGTDPAPKDPTKDPNKDKNPGATPGASNMKWLWIGVAVIVVIGGIYWYTKRKK